ncbi:uncharacterized protein LOC132737431 isoform X2 [Ruditapes philippinarum]|uniref:uncharacterized protein LOC132737431 isoform X2 n=1 Tax=Ruditapes philippinarum TaxID=129788 RepID=UPI00295BE31A|nr:uncharacterized protein LOC132737431 isoform X2 [Ruditapes philippinarum]
MAISHGLTITVLVALATIISVQCQDVSYITPTERQLRANLTQLVQFVLHPSATPSMDLINYALVAGGQPKTQAERDAYLGMMKKMARDIPELVKQFTITETLPGGTKIEKLDNSALDAQIIRRAVQYVKKQQKEQAAKAAQAANASTTDPTVSGAVSGSNTVDLNTGVSDTAVASQAAINIGPLANAVIPTETPIVPGVFTNEQTANVQGSPAVQDLQHNTIIPAADGTISLEDVFMHISSQNANNFGNFGNQPAMFI